MRSSSVLPSVSKMHSSTLVALHEKSEKLTPRPSQVAPRGLGSPSLSRYLDAKRETVSVSKSSEISLLGRVAHASHVRPGVGGFPRLLSAFPGDDDFLIAHGD